MSTAILIPPETIRAIADATDLVDLAGQRVTLRRSGATYTGLCPFHQEKTPSFIVTPARQRFHCFGCGADGDAFRFVMLNEGATFREAALRLAHRAGVPVVDVEASVAAVRPSATRTKLVIHRPEPRPFTLPTGLHRGTGRELRTLAEQRGLSLEGLELADARGLLRFASWRGCPAWLVLDDQGVHAQARRLDKQPWQQIGAKAWTLPGSRAGWPIGTKTAAELPCVVMVEGGPDLLAAHHFIVAEGREQDVAAVAVLGAANTLPEDALNLMAGKRVRLFPHADAAGATAALRWTEQLEWVGCEVDAFRFEGLRRADGLPVGDLNDFANVDADDFEAEQAELLEVLPR